MRASRRLRYVKEILLHGMEPIDAARVIGLGLASVMSRGPSPLVPASETSASTGCGSGCNSALRTARRAGIPATGCGSAVADAGVHGADPDGYHVLRSC